MILQNTKGSENVPGTDRNSYRKGILLVVKLK